jgi:hypothetical protein
MEKEILDRKSAYNPPKQKPTNSTRDGSLVFRIAGQNHPSWITMQVEFWCQRGGEICGEVD